ncbi:MAG: DUF1902 domain-containing protein [Pseudomonadales bacterium]
MHSNKPLTVYADWDPEAGVWVAYSDDVPGLATEAASIDELQAKLEVMVPELISLNDGTDFDHTDVSIELLSKLNFTAGRVA